MIRIKHEISWLSCKLLWAINTYIGNCLWYGKRVKNERLKMEGDSDEEGTDGDDEDDEVDGRLHWWEGLQLCPQKLH